MSGASPRKIKLEASEHDAIPTFANTALPTTTAAARSKRKSVKREEESDNDNDREEKELPQVKREKSQRRSTKKQRVVKEEEEDEDEAEEDEDEEMQEEEEESKEAPASSSSSSSASSIKIPSQVNIDRVRWYKPNGERVAITRPNIPWRAAVSSQQPAAAAAASSSSSSSSSAESCVVYWVTREQRVEDNWCLLFAQELAHSKQVPLRVVFSLVPKFLDATERHYSFMLSGLREVEASLRELNIPFEILIGYAFDTLPAYVKKYNAGAVITCYSPLRINKDWCKKVATVLNNVHVPLLQVDGHNVVPIWIASDKLEYAARTIRPKITRHLPVYLTEFPRVKQQMVLTAKPEPIDWKRLDESLEIDRRVKIVADILPGTSNAFNTLHSFIRSRLHHYAKKRNDPNEKHQSGMSPYLHFGQIAPQRCALEANKYRNSRNESVNSFIEELVVRRELSDNHCEYNEKYDSIDGASAWARDSLVKHTPDARPHNYTTGELEHAVTYDPLWNAAQLQMLNHGKMHGFLRMYWCKKILEWTSSPQLALATSIYLNDRYSLDGRDPNGYVGCAWSIIGTHDMGWSERAIFGKIRYMNYDGCKRKFDVAKFIQEFAAEGSTVGSAVFVANQGKARARDLELAQSANVNIITTTAKALINVPPAQRAVPTSASAAAASLFKPRSSGDGGNKKKSTSSNSTAAAAAASSSSVTKSKR